jgi:predicted nuclease of predicted toxin-antitoxin system
MGLATSSLRLRSATNNYKKPELIWITAGNLKSENEHQIKAALNIERCADMK